MSKRTQTLAISPKRIEDFLMSLVNLHEAEPVVIFDERDLNRFIKTFGDEFGLFDVRFLRAFFGENVVKEEALKRPSPLIPSRTEFETSAVSSLNSVFRATWVEPDARVREWTWLQLRAKFAPRPLAVDVFGRVVVIRDSSGGHRVMSERKVRLPQPPEELPVETAFYYLHKHHNRARFCLNSECFAPYFFTTRHTQRYCSELCAQSGERESKRRWWAEHGADLRQHKKRKASGAKKQTATKKRRTTRARSKKKGT